MSANIMFRWVEIVVLGLLSAINLLFFAHLVVYFDEYRFGTEVAGFRYKSLVHYGGLNLLAMGIGCFGLFGVKLFSDEKGKHIVRVGAIVWLVLDLILTAISIGH